MNLEAGADAKPVKECYWLVPHGIQSAFLHNPGSPSHNGLGLPTSITN